MAKSKKSKKAKPETLQLRGKGRKRTTFEGASQNRLTADWIALNEAPDSMNTSMRVLRDRSRSLARNYDLVAGMFKTITNNTIGRGFKLQAKTKMERGDRFNEKLNAEIEECFSEWSHADTCHTGGELSFKDMQYLLWLNLVEAGEVFVRKVRQPFGMGRIPYALEVIEADQLAEDYYVSARNGQNAIANGVEIDSWGRKVAYWFYKQHPAEWATQNQSSDRYTPMRIPASEVIHLYRSLRPNQRRGIPWIYCSMNGLNHARRYIEAEVIAARLQAAVSVFIERDADDTSQPLDEGFGRDPEDNIEDIVPGAKEYLEPGEKANPFAPSRPNTSANEFLSGLHWNMAAGQGISGEGVTRDFSRTNYSSARSAILEERKSYEVFQQWFIDKVLNIVYKEWLEMAVLCGELNIPRYEMDVHRYSKHAWRSQGWQWVDPLKEAQSATLKLKAGLTTYEKILAEQGEDIQEVMTQIARERDFFASLGLDFDLSTSGKGNSTEEKPEKQLILPRGYKHRGY